jgi:hypothetical protein
MLVICHARSLNLTLKKKVKAQKKITSCVKIVKSPIKKLLVLKKKVKTQQKKSQSCEITDKNIISIFFRSTRIIRSISDSFFEPISYGPDNPCAKKILIINIYLKIFYFLHGKKYVWGLSWNPVSPDKWIYDKDKIIFVIVCGFFLFVGDIF